MRKRLALRSDLSGKLNILFLKFLSDCQPESLLVKKHCLGAKLVLYVKQGAAHVSLLFLHFLFIKYKDRIRHCDIEGKV